MEQHHINVLFRLTASMKNKWLDFNPTLADSVEHNRFLAEARRLALASEGGKGSNALEEVRRRLTQNRGKGSGGAMAAALILADLISHGWRCRIRRQIIQIQQGSQQSTVALSEREQVRMRLHVERNRQLRTPSVQTFLRNMERRRFHRGKWISIFSLMRDGRELTLSLSRELRTAIHPYIQVIKGEESCDITGLALRDIWRYFRHTWANPYRSVPGRSILLLMRDAACEFHPVIGIAALASSAVQISVRDEWIGWDPERFVDVLRESTSEEHVNWLLRLTEDGFTDIYQDDLLDSATSPITRQAISRPDQNSISWLENYAKEQREEHRRLADPRDHKSFDNQNSHDLDWQRRAETPLFRSKRAETLAMLLKVRQMFQREAGRPTPETIKKALVNAESRQAIQSLIRRAKSDRVGVAMADISVSGAIAPYSSLLGGKLVAMLVTSPEVVEAYSIRYSNSSSVIASSMAGRPTIRTPHLVLLGTTSLYGTEPTQYTRLAIPCEQIGGKRGESVRYRLLGRTEGYGTFQFSPDTVEAISAWLSQTEGGMRVHSIFGEGVNPRLRKIREGLDRLNLPSNELLSHGNQRLVYAVALARNFREYLLGLDSQPDYLFPLGNASQSTQKIVEWWTERWLMPRLRREGILEEVSSHRLTHPIKHGARVPFTEDARDQISLFSDINGDDPDGRDR